MPSIGRGLPTRKSAPGKSSSSSSSSRRRSRGLPFASSSGTPSSSNSNSASGSSSSIRPSGVSSSSSSSRRNSLPTSKKKKVTPSSKLSSNNNTDDESSGSGHENSQSPKIKSENGNSSSPLQESTAAEPQILVAKFDKAGAIQMNGGNRSGSSNWTVTLVVNSKAFDPQEGSSPTGFRIKREDNGDSSSNYRPRRHRSYSKDLDAADMLGDEENPDVDSEGSSTDKNKGMSSPSSGTSIVKKIKGKDGNFHYCKVCGETGEVVCCDGCPQVYHPQCLPVDSESFAALDTQNDDDPWYCPDCVERKKSDGKSSSNSNSSKKKKRKSEKITASPGGDGDEIMSPYRQQRPKRKCSVDMSDAVKKEIAADGDNSSGELTEDEDGDPVAVAVAEDDVSEDENAEISEALTSPRTPTKSSSSSSKNRSISPKSSAKKSSSGLLSSLKKKPKSKKRPLSPMRVASPVTPKSEKKKDKKKKKKKKKKERSGSSDSGGSDDNARKNKGGKERRKGGMLTHMLNNKNPGMVQAVPAFYFFLLENKNKIDRSLSRKHRYFNRLPKANMERNQLIAKEGIVMWSKLSETEVQRYMEISMKDYEQKIIEWKEEKTLRSMMAAYEEGDPGETLAAEEKSDPHRDALEEDERLTHDNHQRLYLSTTVGSKPYKPDMEESNNRILLELLQDTRFHPLPMLQCTRGPQEYGEMDFERITIPYFDINGPVSTCLGDECLGCSRGWTHFCNVLKRRIPAVARRAKLQPPLSSLVATRIGLGLRNPPLVIDDDADAENQRNGASSKANGGIKKTSDCDVETFTSRDIPSAAAAKALPHYPWEPLTDPTDRADDIVRFVEEAVCMKIPEPPRPGGEDMDVEDANNDGHGNSRRRPSINNSVLSLNLESRGQKRRPSYTEEAIHGEDDDEDVTVNKCGRCRTIIEGDTGCVPCRRAQLVINMSRGEGQADENSSKILRVQTNMLGRLVMRDGEVDNQEEGDEAISNHILRQRWAPFAILPPTTLTSPIPKYDDDSDSSNEDDSSDESEQDEEDEDVVETTGDGPDSMELDDKKDDDNVNTVSDDTMDTEEDSSGNEDPAHRPRKRLRASSRIEALESNGNTSNGTSTKIIDTGERSVLIKKFKEETNNVHRKCVSIACNGLLLALTRRDPLLHFAEPVEAEGYYDIIKKPMDFGKMRKKVHRNKYATLGAFVSDAQLLCDNAMIYNPADSIYYKTAKELSEVLSEMQKRASEWINTIKDAHAATFNKVFGKKSDDSASDGGEPSINEKEKASASSSNFLGGDPFVRLRKEWPEAVEMFEENDWLYQSVESDFMRTKENEAAYYGSLAIRRAAMAAAVSLAPYTDSGGMFNTVGRRTFEEDEKLRNYIANRVAENVTPPELKEIPSWREEMIMRVLRKSQARRMEGRMGSTHGCARCDGVLIDRDSSKALNAATVRWGRTRKKPNEVPRIHKSRLGLSTGLGSQITQDRIQKHKQSDVRKGLRKGKLWALVAAANKVNEVAVTARGSRIHGMGLFADQPLLKGDVVAEYVGEYVCPAVTDAREKIYQKERIQDYQFRIDSQLIIDATKRGGHGRYANHNCDPNCTTKIIPFEMPSKSDGRSEKDGTEAPKTKKRGKSLLKRVVIVALRDIEPMEELTYDYQFPLEVNMDERIPCNCNSELCRGFMNWDLPEKGAKNQVFRTQKRGANMRDRIRRLGRPLKGDR